MQSSTKSANKRRNEQTSPETTHYLSHRQERSLVKGSAESARWAATDANVGAVKAEVGGVIRSLAGQHVHGRTVRFGGLPGYAYRVHLGAPTRGVSRLFVLFDKRVEYFFNWQSTP